MNPGLPLGPSLREGRAGVRRESRPAAGADLTSSLTVRPHGGKAAGPVAHAGTGGTSTATALPTVDLDTATVEQLQPPCEVVYYVTFGGRVIGREPCDRPAEWIVRSHCIDCHGDATGLLCTVCLAAVGVWTHGCGGVLVPCGEPERLK